MPTSTADAHSEIKKIILERDIQNIKIGVFDIDGILRGKYVSREKFLSVLEKGLGFCSVIYGWDCDDKLYDNVKFTGWHTGYADVPVKILPETMREMPLESNTLFVLGELAPPADEICPRRVLQRILSRAEGLGFTTYAALEYEFFLFAETHETLEAKQYRDLQPLTPGNFGYSVLRSGQYAEFYHELLALAKQMDFPIEGLHTETGPGVLEAALVVDTALRAADKAALFKTFTKILAQKYGWMATFMAKWSAKYPGQSGHIHMSLYNAEKKSLFFDANDKYGMSKIMQQFVAGQQRLMPELLAMIAPTVNSYTRLIPGFWAPTAATWGVENRTCALRVIPGDAKSQRVEYRIAAADGNPYLGLSVALASGLWGIQQELELTPPILGNAYQHEVKPEFALPTNLQNAADKLRASKVAREYFGDAFVEHFAATRDWEVREAQKAITDWQLQRYFEII